MADLDLDITHYELQDLESFFQLEQYKTYTANELEIKEAQMRTLLLSTGHIPKHLKGNLIAFLKNAREILVQHKVPKQIPHTTLPKNHYDSKSISSNNIPSNNFPVKEPEKWPTREEEIIVPKQTPYTYTQTSEYFPGVLNPIDTRTLKKCLTIDTRFRKNYTQSQSSDFTISLPNRIPKVISMECTSFEIAPATIPNISESLENDYLYVAIVTETQKFSQVFVLTDGYYTTIQILDAFNVLFAQQEHTPFMYIELVFDPEDSGKIALTTTDDTKTQVMKIKEIQLDFRVNKYGTVDKKEHFAKMGRMLGFTKRTYYYNFTYVAETVPNPFLDLTYFYLVIDDFQNRSALGFEPAFSQITMPPAILARLSFQSMSQLSYHSKVEALHLQCVPRKYFGPVDIHRLHIRLVDAYGNTIQMDDADYSFSLVLNTVYDL